MASPQPNCFAKVDNEISGSGTFGTVVQAGQIDSITVNHSEATRLLIPRQLPRRTVPFMGRNSELDLMAAHLGAGDGPVVLYGPHGSGKSRLPTEALVGHDGPHLYADLRGIESAEPLLTVLSAWLRALGHPGPWASTGEAAAWWRTITASGQPPAVLLDNADGTQPVGLLLPVAGPIVITSLGPRHELAADGAIHFVGCLVLQYGQSTDRIVNLTLTQVHIHPDEPGVLGLRLGRETLWLRPRLSALVQRLVHERRPLAAALKGQETPYLFPGLRPSSHLSSNTLQRRLQRLGIPSANKARNGAWLALVGAVRWKMLADLLGAADGTAHHWHQWNGGDRASYVASRLRAAQAPTSPE